MRIFLVFSLSMLAACGGNGSPRGKSAQEEPAQDEAEDEFIAPETDPVSTSSEAGGGDLSDLIGEAPKSETSVLTALSASLAEGSHTPGGGSCPEGQDSLGSFADCGGGTCNGNLRFCGLKAAFSTLKPDDVVVTAMTLSAENAHVVGGTPCASGFTKFMSVADCGGGVCNGNQIFCMKTTKVKDLAKAAVVTAIAITPENTHQVGGTPCAEGYVSVGTTADCGMGQCSGSQSVCVKSEKP